MDQPAIQLRILLAQHAVGGLERSRGDRAQARGSRPDDTRLDDPVGDRARDRRPRRSCRGSPSWRGPIPRRWSGSTWPRHCSGCRWRTRWEIVAGLVGHAEDAADHNLPLMYWYAAEPLAGLDASRAARLAADLADSADPGVHGASDRRAGHAANRWRSWSTSSGRAPRLRPAIDALDRDRGIAARPAPGCDARRLAQGLSRRWPLTRTGRSARGRRPWRSPSATRRRGRRCGGVLADAKADSCPAAGGSGGLAQGEGPAAGRHLARAWCGDPGLGGHGRPRAVGLRRSGDARGADQGLHVARADRAARRLEHTGRPQGLGPGACWPRSRRASCPRAI